MKKIVFLFFIFINISFALEVVDFEDRQKVLQDVKSIILYEESIARAYEEYILTNYAIPTLVQIKVLIGDVPTTVSGLASTLSLDSSLTKISYGLSSDLEDSSIKALYESSTFRKRTYFRNDKINFILEDEFAKHLYDLIKQKGSGLGVCSGVANEDCIKNSHIYIKPIYVSGEITSFLINYHIDKFKTGPIIITNDTSKHITEDEFDSIPKGALLYDVFGVKYVKTLEGIRALK